MQIHLLAIPLPLQIRSQLNSFCYGLPQVDWVAAENLYVPLRHLGPLSDLLLNEIHESLKSLFFISFPLILKEIGHFHTKSNRGVIWAGIEKNDQLTLLKKEIDKHLRAFLLPKEERSFQPHVILGHYNQFNLQKFADFFSFHSSYRSEPFLVECFLLLCAHQTPKNFYYRHLENYSASRLATGED